MSDEIDRKLWKAAERGDEAVMRQFIEQGASVDWKGQHGFTTLHKAAIKGHTHVLPLLLDAGWSLEAMDYHGLTPLTRAALGGQLETAKCLLLRGANIDAQDNDCDTPLHRASDQGHTELVQLLLQCGANQEIRNHHIKSSRKISSSELLNLLREKTELLEKENTEFSDRSETELLEKGKNEFLERGKTAQEEAKNEETRAVFKEFNEKGLNTKVELFDRAVEENKYDVAAILAYTSKDENVLNKIIELLKIDSERFKIQELTFLDYFDHSASQNHPIAENIFHYFIKNSSSF